MSGSNEYAAWLRDPRWRQKIDSIKKRDDYTCQRCGADGPILQVHHKYYLRDCKPWEYDDFALVTLCSECHYIEEGYRRDAQETFMRNCAERGLSSEQTFHVAGAVRSISSYCNPEEIHSFIKWLFGSEHSGLLYTAYSRRSVKAITLDHLMDLVNARM